MGAGTKGTSGCPGGLPLLLLGSEPSTGELCLRVSRSGTSCSPQLLQACYEPTVPLATEGPTRKPLAHCLSRLLPWQSPRHTTQWSLQQSRPPGCWLSIRGFLSLQLPSALAPPCCGGSRTPSAPTLAQCFPARCPRTGDGPGDGGVCLLLPVGTGSSSPGWFLEGLEYLLREGVDATSHS